MMTEITMQVRRHEFCQGNQRSGYPRIRYGAYQVRHDGLLEISLIDIQTELGKPNIYFEYRLQKNRA